MSKRAVALVVVVLVSSLSACKRTSTVTIQGSDAEQTVRALVKGGKVPLKTVSCPKEIVIPTAHPNVKWTCTAAFEDGASFPFACEATGISGAKVHYECQAKR